GRIPRRSRHAHGHARPPRPRQLGGAVVRARAGRGPRAHHAELRRPAGARLPGAALTSALHLLAERARREPDGVAYRSKRLGLYEERTWRRYADLVARCAVGFQALGIKPGERIAIMGDT